MIWGYYPPSLGSKQGYARWFPVTFQPDVNKDRRTRERVEREVMIGMGALAAEQILRGRSSWNGGGSNDVQKAFDIASYIFCDADEVSAFVKWLYLRTLSLLRAEWHWRGVQAIAAALLARHTISGKRARELVRGAYDQSLADWKEKWQAKEGEE
jgi:hypothetical protein